MEMSKKTFAYKWEQSPAHVWFLTTFLKPRLSDDHFMGVDWQMALGEPPAKAIERFMVQGVLVRAPLNVQADMQLTLDQLKKICQAQELKVSGRKGELIARLIAADQAALLAELDENIFQCSARGHKLAEQYLSNPESVLRNTPPQKKEEDTLTPQKMRKILRWLLLEGIVLGVVGNAVYDLLKELGGEIIEAFENKQPVWGKFKTISLAPGAKLEFCYVPAGEFLMGSAASDREAYDNEKPQHRVYVDAFYLGKYPVTNAQYRVFVQKTGHRQPYRWKDGFPHNKVNHPVSGVSWSDAVAFCEWAARATGKPIRLLTEAEWEKGARGTDGRIYPWGNTWQPAYCNTKASGIKDTTPVDRYPRGHSPYEVYDMIGNVWEWTSTIYQPYPYKADDGREASDKSKWHVFRGGSYLTEKRRARAAYRAHDDDFWSNVGFRVGVAAPFSFL